jgi:hypothetical protein
MNYVLPLLAVLLSQTASAQVLQNVSGITGRLETISCMSGAGVAPMSQVQKLYAKVEASCQVPESESENCINAALKKLTKPANVIFRGSAIDGTIKFDMNIFSGGTTYSRLFHSIRVGHHADMNGGGISLAFRRDGVSDDEFMMETAALKNEGNRTEMLMVPVKKRLAADQVYFFFGCDLSWKY